MTTSQQLADPRLASMLLHHEVSRFYTYEAALLDEHRFDDWLGLLTPDVHYWAPVQTNRMPTDPISSVESSSGAAFFDDDLASMRVRVRRLTSDRAWSEIPRSRTRHLVTNIEVDETDQPDEYRVRSNVLVYRSRSDHYQDLFPGARLDVLRRSADQGFAIAKRRIILDQAVLFAVNISTFF